MKTLSSVAIILVCIFCLNLSANAQKVKRRTPTKNPPTATATTGFSGNDIKDESEKISIQIKNLTKFIYLLGGIANVLEDDDKNAKARKLPMPNKDKKEAVINSIHNVRVGIIALESDFRTKPKLKPYLPNIQGVSDMCANAEDLAVGGQFYASGKSLLEVVNKLTDVLKNLR